MHDPLSLDDQTWLPTHPSHPMEKDMEKRLPLAGIGPT